MKKADNFDVKKWLVENKITTQSRLTENNDSPISTNWVDLDWDFSDSDSVNFGDFEVDIDQFKPGIKNGYVVDGNGVKRAIDKSMIKSILQSYKENFS